MDDLKARLARKMYEGVRGKREPDVSFDEQVEPCREAYFDGAQIAIDMLGADRIEALENAAQAGFLLRDFLAGEDVEFLTPEIYNQIKPLIKRVAEARRALEERNG
jgi:hypothetical protein